VASSPTTVSARAPISQPEAIANAVAGRASDEARHVTGVQLPVDLGILGR
jgi:NAD(P)-dependent dehydrogenase (short-subunit alcohol dehydrogenase family)